MIRSFFKVTSEWTVLRRYLVSAKDIPRKLNEPFKS